MFAPVPGPALGPVLGIDPGVSRCGYGAVVRGATRQKDLQAVRCGVISTPPAEPLEFRLLTIANELDALLGEIRPSAIAVERVFFQTNVRTAMSVGQASGLVLVAAARAGIPVAQYTSNEVKQAVVGYGGADKAQVQAMVQAILRLDEPPRPPDAADALALAICHLSVGPMRQKILATTQEGLGGLLSKGTLPGLASAIERAVAK